MNSQRFVALSSDHDGVLSAIVPLLLVLLSDPRLPCGCTEGLMISGFAQATKTTTENTASADGLCRPCIALLTTDVQNTKRYH